MDDGLTSRLAALDESGDVDALNELGCELAEVGLQEEAAGCFRRAADLGSVTGRFNLGCALHDLGRLEAAAVAFEAAALGGESDAWLGLGNTRCQLGDSDGGIRAYRAGAAAGDSDAMLGLAFELREQGDRDGAMVAATEAADTGNVDAKAVVACWRWCSTRDLALEADLRAGAEHFPAARSDLADLLLATGRAEEGRAVLERGAKLGEQDSFLPLGNLYVELGMLADAEDAYRADIAAGDLYGHNNLGTLLLGRGDIEGALAQFRLGADGGDRLAERHLLQLLEEADE